MGNTTYEYCPHCEAEVELKAELSVQKCPNCGMYIVACSMCEECISHCKFDEDARRLNSEKSDKQISKNYTVNITMKLFRTAEIEAKSEADAIRLAREMVHSEEIVFDIDADCAGIDIYIDK